MVFVIVMVIVMVHGAWFVVHGSWFMVHVMFKVMVHGRSHGSWFTVLVLVMVKVHGPCHGHDHIYNPSGGQAFLVTQ